MPVAKVGAGQSERLFVSVFQPYFFLYAQVPFDNEITTFRCEPLARQR